MVLTSDQERIRLLLSDTVMLLCKNGLCFQSKFSVDAVIGITLDDNDVFLVNIRETVGLDMRCEESVRSNVNSNVAVQRDTNCGELVQQNIPGVEFVLRDTDNEKTGRQDTDVLGASHSEAQMEQSNESVLPTPNDLNIGSNMFPSVTSSVIVDFPTTQKMLSSSIMSLNPVKSSPKFSFNRSPDTDEGRPLKIIRLTDIRSEKSNGDAGADGDSALCEVTIKSEPTEEQNVKDENRLSIANEIYDTDTNVTSNPSNKSKPYIGRRFESFGCSAASLDCLNLSHDRTSMKYNLTSTAHVNQQMLSQNRVEKSTPLGRSPASVCLNLSRDSTAAKDFDLTTTADSSCQILSQNHSEKMRPSVLSRFSQDENAIPMADDSTSSDQSEKDQNQHWPMSYSESCLKFPWGALDASDNLSSLRDLKFFSDEFKPAAELYRPSLDWVPSMKNIFTRQSYNHPQLDDTALQLPEHVARDCIQTILLYDGRYVPVRDIQRLRLCGQSSGMIRAAMIMLDDHHQGALGFYRELPTGVALLYKCPPERVDVEKLQSFGIGLDIYHMRYYTLPSLNATTRHCDSYWQRIESYSPYV